MSLFKQIKADQLEARKAKNTITASLLTTLIGEIQTAVTGGASASQFGILNPTDEETTKVIKKFVKNINETLRLKDNPTSRLELATLELYLPQMLSDAQLEALVTSITLQGTLEGKLGGALVGYVMKQLKESYANQYDASKVKGLVEGVSSRVG